MTKKSALIISLVVAVAAIAIFILVKNKNTPSEVASTPTPAVNLPVNTIPVEERPFITLSPDNSGRSLYLMVNGAPEEDLLEYELVYQASEKQEGVFGRLNLASEMQPIEKKLLLGSQSSGGKITYHEGVTGGSLTTTYGDIKLKEQFNFLHFDNSEPSVSSPDVRFTVDFEDIAFAKNAVIIVMKSFGLPAGLPAEATKLLAGPYSYQAASVAKGDVVVSLKLPAGEYTDPLVYEYDETENAWVALETELDGDTVTAPAISGTTFLVAN